MEPAGVFLFHSKPSKFCCFCCLDIIKEIGKELFLHVCMPSFLLCDRPIDLKGNEATKSYCECFRMSLFV